MRTLGKLTNLEVKRKKRPGVFSDGGGLYLQVAKGGSKSWLFRYFVGEHDPKTGGPLRDPVTGKTRGRTRDMGLGSFATVPLEEARRRAAECRVLREQGVDPLEHREGAKRQAILEKARALTFRQCAAAYIAAHRAGWRSERHAAQWSSSLENDAYPVIGDVPVQEIDVALVLKVLQPIWEAKPETASRIRGRIELVLDAARAQGRIAQGVANPARWKGHLQNLLPRRSKMRLVKRHPALPHGEMPAFMEALRAREGVVARGLEFLILSAARSGEVLGARWSEFDLRGKLWTVPAERMKGGREHRVPLSKRALAILAERLAAIDRLDEEFAFRRSRADQPLSRIAMWQMLPRLGRDDLTVHGFRATFRSWGAERTNFPREVCELALAHATGSAVEAAYQRSDLIEQRRQLLDAWDRFCSSSPAAGEVVPLNASRT